MEEHKNNSRIISSLFWKMMESGGTQAIQFLVQIILARLLLPKEYGLIALVNVFILLANVFIQSGLNSALIQKKDVDEDDYSSVFVVSLIMAVLLYLVLFFIAPLISNFYRNKDLILMLRVLSIILIPGAINSIQNAYIARNMMFSKLFFSSLWAIVISGLIGVYTAFIGWGVWALVSQQIVNQFVITIILWSSIKWRPKLVFSIKKMKVLLSYGWKLLASSLLNTLYTDFRTIIIGRIFSPDMLGYYNRGRQFPQILVANINGSIQSVMLPALSINQDDKVKVKSIMRKAVMTSSFFLFPMMIGLAILAEPIVIIVLTEKWLPAVPFLQIYCVIFALRPIHTANVQAINALGRSDIFLKIEIIRSVIGIAVLFITIPFGIYAIAFGELISAIISTILYSYPNKNLIGYSIYNQYKDLVQPILLSMIMGILVFLSGEISSNLGVRIVVQILLGILIYISLSILFKVETYAYLKDIGLKLIKSKVKRS